MTIKTREMPSQEKDPCGLDPHQEGAKLDDGKPKVAQILGMFSRALWEVSRVGTYGANKYTMGGWQSVSDGINRYDDAELRHYLKRGMGEVMDSELPVMHSAQRAWNALAILELELRKLQKEGEWEPK